MAEPPRGMPPPPSALPAVGDCIALDSAAVARASAQGTAWTVHEAPRLHNVGEQVARAMDAFREEGTDKCLGWMGWPTPEHRVITGGAAFAYIRATRTFLIIRDTTPEDWR